MKEIFAHELTELVHGKEEADKALAAAKALFAGGGDDSNMPTTQIPADKAADGMTIMELLEACSLIPSRSEGRRLIEQGGVSVDGEKVTSINDRISKEQLEAGVKIKKGKKTFHKAIIG
jgi:tyrosyl-tRNA synthetase